MSARSLKWAPETLFSLRVVCIADCKASTFRSLATPSSHHNGGGTSYFSFSIGGMRLGASNMGRRCVRPEYSRGFSYHSPKILSSRALMFRLFFFFSCKDEKITGWIHGHCPDSVSVFPFQSQKTSLCTSSSEEHVCPYTLPVFHHITSHPSSSFLFLLLSFFF